jgi:hypothetical protein
MAALSLRQCLEYVAALGTDYLLTDYQGEALQPLRPVPPAKH